MSASAAAPLAGSVLPAEAAAAPVLGVARSLTGRRWVWREGESRIALGIAERHALPEIVGRLIAARGLDVEDAADFLAPTLRALLPDPSRLADMDRAAARLAAAVRRGETVAVFGDYDVDGACAAALLITVLRRLGCRTLFHVPDRITEGYGPNAPALRALADRGATLVVCVDCGTAAPVPLAALAGRAEVIVLDHHKSDGGPPPVLATVNPNRLDCRSGLRHLCAAAIAFLAAVATLRDLRRGGFFSAQPEPDLRELLDLVALATICDVVPLTGLNRAFVVQGLRVMGRRARPGIAALLDLALARQPDAFTCGYALGPRINAGGRISEADLGLRLLLSEEPVAARALAERLDAVNRQRQQVEADMLAAAFAAAEAQIAAGHAAVLISGEAWHPGVVGIVASRVKERVNRPVCVGGVADGLVRGSGRSVPGLDLGAAVIAALQAGILSTGGGHAMAAGFSFAAGQAAAFHAHLDERLAAARQLPRAADLAIEASLSIAGATPALAQAVARLAPFGAGNEEPVFVLPRVRVAYAERLGAEGATLRCHLEGEGGGRLKGLLFRADQSGLSAALAAGAPLQGAPLHIAGQLRAEIWNAREAACFVIADAVPC